MLLQKGALLPQQLQQQCRHLHLGARLRRVLQARRVGERGGGGNTAAV
jgi:hypothetical protein